MKKTIALIISLSMLASMAACSAKPEKNISGNGEPVTEAATEDTTEEYEYKYQKYASMSPEEIVAVMTLEQKTAQMVQPAVYNVSEDDMKENDYGSILSTMGCIGAAEWRETVDGFQQAAIESESGIPYIYGQDDVHGVNYCKDAVYFPHNIGQGAANDEDLAYQVGLITADEAKLCHMLWNFSPCVAQSVDPRWGRTYESYGSDLETITKLSTAYTKGLIDGGLVACAKHFFADGNVVYGTGEQGDIDMLIDRGDAQLSDAEIEELLKVYQAQIDAGVQTIMISHSSLNGVKMHENKEYIMKLKDDMGFEGFIVSDWGSVGNISGSSYEEQVIKSVNAGIDMLMETDRFEEAQDIIMDAVDSGDISQERINDAVTRIIKVKKDAGLFDDPLCEDITTGQKDTGSLKYRAVAEKLVEESLVLLKNDKEVLPFKEGTKIYITGPAADNGQVQCGGWTMDWNAAPVQDVPGVTTILEAFERYAEDYGIEVITDENEAANADVVLLCVGEQAYAEWNGDTEDLELCGDLGLKGNADAIIEAKKLGKPTVTCIVAGRNVILDEKDYEDWDSVVMCYLPGSEGKGISDVLCGCADFTGKLPSDWYGSLEQIGTDECFLERGYGESYGADFKPRKEPDAQADVAKAIDQNVIMEGTDFQRGLFKDGVYVNSFADLVINIPGELKFIDESEYMMMRQGYIDSITDEKEKAVETSLLSDAYFMGDDEGVSVDFLNTKLLESYDDDINEEDCLDYWKEIMISNLEGLDLTYSDREKVSLCGHEYLRQIAEITDGVHGVQTVFKYVRKIDDSVMAIIEITTMTDKKASEYEALFGGSASSDGDSDKTADNTEATAAGTESKQTENEGSADADPLTAGTNYKKGSYSECVYTNEYADITLNLPDYLTPSSGENVGMVYIPDNSTEADRLRIDSQFSDAEFWKYPGSDRDTDYITVTFLNTEIGLPDNPDCTEEEYLDIERDYLKRTMPVEGVKVDYTERKKVTLSGHEYLREICWIEGVQILYTYARRIDDKMICVINISGIKPVDSYEAMFI